MSEKELPRSLRQVLLLVAVVIIPFTSWSPTPWMMGVFALLISAVFFADFRTVLSTGHLYFTWSSLWIPFLLLYALSLYHLAVSPVPYSSLLFLSQLTVSLVFFQLLLSWEAKIPTRTVVLIWVGVLVLWISADALISGVRSPGGPFFNPNYLATVILSCLGYLAGTLMDSKEKRGTEPVLAASALMCTAGLLLIGSRSAALGVLLVYILLMIRRSGWMRWAAAVVIAFILLVPSTVRHRVTQEYRQDPHAFSRIDIWQAALKMGADHPLAGVGPNLFYEHGPVYAFPIDELPVRYGRIVRKPHNEYLRSWAEGGLAGITAAGLFVFLTLNLMIRSWIQGRAGPPLAMGAVMFQALFHDVTEVFALMVLAVWWLAHLVPRGERQVELGKNKGVILAAVVAVILTGSSVWLNLDVASRAVWAAGRQRVETDIHSAERSLKRSLLLNPLFPGAARDLAQMHLNMAREGGTGASFETAADSILQAWKRNRLDTVPLRLQAALYVELARRSNNVADQALRAAVETLNQAVELEPHNALILVNLADVYWELDQRPRALNLIEQALIKEPNYLAAHRKKVSYLSELDPGNVREAEMELEKAAQRASNYRPYSTYEEIILK